MPLPHADDPHMCRTFRRGLRDDQGFTLIESVAALLVATIIFMALAATMISGVRASLTSRQNQQATDFMTRELEQGRLMDFAALGHTASDLVGDSRLSSCGTSQCFDPGTGTLEKVVVLPVGAGIPDHTTEVALDQANGTTFSLNRYVTEVPGQDVSMVRRLTVIVSWSTYGRSHTRTTSSIVAFSQRGLPLPSFKLTPVGPTTVSAAHGATAVFGARLTNQGATDRWNLTTTPTGWEIVLDDGDGVYDASLDTTLATDTNGDAIVDTGVVVPAGTATRWLRRTIAASEPVGPSPVTLTAKSVGQPTAATAESSLVFTLDVTTGSATPVSGTTPPPSADDCAVTPPSTYVVSGYTGIGRIMHNDNATNPDTTTLPDMVMNSASPYLTGDLGKYSMDRDTMPGRLVDPSTNTPLAETSPSKFAQWRVQFGQKTQISGPGRLRVWLSAPLTTDVQLQVTAFTSKSNGDVLQQRTQAATLTGFTCAGWQELWVDTPDLTAEVPNNGYLGVRVTHNSANSIRLAYDTTSYAASFMLGQK